MSLKSDKLEILLSVSQQKINTTDNRNSTHPKLKLTL